MNNKAAFTKTEKDEYYEKLRGFMKKRGWKESGEGESLIFKKEKGITEGSFLDMPKKKNLPEKKKLIQKIEDFFKTENIEKRVKENIAMKRKEGESFLVNSAVQYFRDVFWEERNFKTGTFYIPQPVVRMKSFNNPQEGYTTSFVNSSTIGINSSIEKHLDNLDRWFDLFSKVGLYLGNFSLETVPSKKYAQNKKGVWANTDGLSLGINYLDLNLGDAGFIKIPQENRENLTISDIGFGLERILWGVYKNKSYFELMGPDVEYNLGKYKTIDNTRSATLLSMKNAKDFNKDAYNQFRKFTRELAKDYGNFDLYRLVEHNNNYWSYFLEGVKNVEKTYFHLRSEIENEKGNI